MEKNSLNNVCEIVVEKPSDRSFQQIRVLVSSEPLKPGDRLPPYVMDYFTEYKVGENGLIQVAVEQHEVILQNIVKKTDKVGFAMLEY